MRAVRISILVALSNLRRFRIALNAPPMRCVASFSLSFFFFFFILLFSSVVFALEWANARLFEADLLGGIVMPSAWPASEVADQNVCTIGENAGQLAFA